MRCQVLSAYLFKRNNRKPGMTLTAMLIYNLVMDAKRNYTPVVSLLKYIASGLMTVKAYHLKLPLTI